jgi:hypothetical protein
VTDDNENKTEALTLAARVDVAAAAKQLELHDSPERFEPVCSVARN